MRQLQRLLFLMCLFLGLANWSPASARPVAIPDGYDRVVLNETGTYALVYSQNRPGVSLVDVPEDLAAFVQFDLPPVSVVSLSRTPFFAVSYVDRRAQLSFVTIYDAARGERVYTLRLAEDVNGLFVSEDGLMFLGDAALPQMHIVDLCRIEALSMLFDFWRCDGFPRISKTGRAKLFLNGTFVSDMADDPATGILIAFDGRTGEFLGIDRRSLKIQFSGGVRLEPLVEMTPAIDGRNGYSLYFSSRYSLDVNVMDIEPAFRDWRSAGRIDLEDHSGTEVPVVDVSDLIRGRTEAGPDLKAKLNVSRDQSRILAQTRTPNRLRMLAREGSAYKLLFDIVATDGPILDFALSANGNRVAFLSDGALEVVGFQDLAERATRPTKAFTFVQAMQDQLAALGYFTEAVDGNMSQETRAALERFAAFDLQKVSEAAFTDPRQLPAGVLFNLFGGDLAALPYQELPPETVKAMFDQFFGDRLPAVSDFGANEFYRRGRSSDACVGENASPPPETWENIAGVVTILQRLRQALDEPISVLSAHQSQDYAACAGLGIALDAHRSFAAAEFSVKGLGVDETLAAARELGLTRDAEFEAGPRGVHLRMTQSKAEPEIGTYQTPIAAYTASESGCAFARSDVDEFAVLLDGKGLAGRRVFVAQAPGKGEDLWVVSIDMGDDRTAAATARDIVRQVAPDSADKKTGADSYVDNSNGWSIGACQRSYVLR